MNTLRRLRLFRARGWPLPSADPLRTLAYRGRRGRYRLTVPRRFAAHYGSAHRRYRQSERFVRPGLDPCWSEFSRNYYRRRYCPPSHRLQRGTRG